MNTPPVFDYSSFHLSDSRCRFLEKCALSIEYQNKLNLAGIYQIGKALSSARSVFGQDRANFSRWLKARCPFLSRDLAFRLFSLYRRFNVSLLRKDISIDNPVLFSLLSPKTQYPVCTEIITLALSGSHVTQVDFDRVNFRRNALSRSE